MLDKFSDCSPFRNKSIAIDFKSLVPFFLSGSMFMSSCGWPLSFFLFPYPFLLMGGLLPSSCLVLFSFLPAPLFLSGPVWTSVHSPLFGPLFLSSFPTPFPFGSLCLPPFLSFFFPFFLIYRLPVSFFLTSSVSFQ